VNYAYNACVSTYTPQNAWEMYIKMCCVLTQIVFYLFSLFNDKLYSFFKIVKAYVFFHDIRLHYDNLQGRLHIHFMFHVSQICSRQ